MAHMVICKVCGEKFDRDKVQAVKASARRYAHFRCMPEGEKVELPNPIDEDLVQLEEYLKELFQYDFVPPRVKKQIQKYKEEYGWSYLAILNSLKWWYEVKGNSKEKANGGVGILPFIYEDAKKYYYYLSLAKISNNNKTVEMKVREIEIESPSVVVKQRRLFDLDDDNEEGEDD